VSSSCVVNELKAEVNISEEQIRDEVSRVLQSAVFVQSDRLSRFLRFTVETTLAGRADTLKEYLIGTEVYDRKPPYHPSADSIVRSEARRLRSKLKQYYESAGRDDPVFIYYRRGSYVPVFRLQRSGDRSGTVENDALGELLRAGLATQGLDLSFIGRELDVQIIFEGTVRVLRAGAAVSSTDSPSAQSGIKRTQIRKVISVVSASKLRARSLGQGPRPPQRRLLWGREDSQMGGRRELLDSFR
jgi:hypothetical protein